MKNLYQVQKKDLKKCANTLARAFQDYPMYKYILEEQNSLEHLEITTRFFVNYAFYYADIYASSPEIEGVIAFVDYDEYKINFLRSLRCGVLRLAKLGSKVGKRFNEYEAFNAKIHRDTIKDKHQYILFLVVDPNRQGLGLGGKLLRTFLELAEVRQLPTYLETHDKKNVDIYLRFGFELAGEYQLPNSDIVLYSMLKKQGGRIILE